MAVLTFVAHQKLPYLKMLVLTGIMLGVVMLVMVGESVKMQQANSLGTTTLEVNMPDWLNTWFAVYPSAESLWAQLLAGVLVIGSYFAANY